MLFCLSLLQCLGNMNGNVYGISNPNVSEYPQFSTEFSKINASSEYFDVYSPPITSRYAEVYWTMMPHVPLPENIVKRFDGKMIAIVGYEVNQVFRYSNGSETPVPITWAYNHHYEAYLRNDNTDFYQVDPNTVDEEDLGQYNHGARAQWRLRNLSEYNMNSLYFSEANGGEFRASFHGYPNGYAQLLRSPKYFNIQPMQIDTRNRDPKYINDSVFHPGIMPANSAAPSDAVYSGLLECPCTTRINKTVQHFYNNLIEGECNEVVLNASQCYNQARMRGMSVQNVNKSVAVIKTHNAPYGCFYNSTGSYVNQYYDHTGCGDSNKSPIYGLMNDTTTGVSCVFSIQPNHDTIHMLLTGPSNVWYGIAFGATAMKDLPYSIIVEGTGNVFEQKLGNHGPGTKLSPAIKILSDTKYNGLRTVSLTRNLSVSLSDSNDYYDFSGIIKDINMMSAIGSGPTFSYHRKKSTSELYVKTAQGNTCICSDGKIGTINGIRFQKNCRPEPYGDLIRQHNPSCFIETYQGGQSCCHHKWVLLDIDQKQPEPEMTYYLKFRYWFQDYSGHKQMVRAYYQTESYSGEYDVPKAPPGTPPSERIHSITAHWQVNEMVDKHYQSKNSKGFALIYAAPHCHAPMCIDVELYNADTGDLICHVDGILGNGNDSIPYNEEGYLKLNPCVWGEDSGIMRPTRLFWNSNLTSIKRTNNTYKHYGEMASWQMRGIVVY